MNYVHVGFTFLMLWQIPQVKQLLKSENSPLGFKKISMVFAVLIAASWAFYLSGTWTIEKQIVPGYSNFELSWFLYSLWGFFHYMAQTRGLSALYSKNSPLGKSGMNSQFSNIQKQERWAFGILFLTIIIHRVALLVKVDPALVNGTIVLSFLPTLFIFLNSFRFGSVLKTTYLSRVIAYPMAPLSLDFFFLIQAVHGIEYFLVTRKMFSQTENKKVFGLTWAALTFGVFIFLVQFFHDEWSFFPFLNVGLIPLLYPYLYGLILVFATLHYYVDSFLFRFSNPSVREWISPLLKNPTPAKN